MIRFLHAADIHLDSPLRRLEGYEGAPVEALRGATRQAFDNLVRLALETPVDFVLIAGDLYDGDWRDYNTGLFLTSRLQRLREAGVPVLLISGNHDAANTMTRTLRLPEGCVRFPEDRPGTHVIEHLKVAVHGQGFAEPAVREDLSAAYPPPIPGYFNIGLLHTAAGGREGHEPYAPCSPSALAAKGYDYWALGHVHQREVLGEFPFIVFPGNLQGRHVREPGPKGCYRVEAASAAMVRLVFEPLSVVTWATEEVDAEGVDSPEALVDRIGEAASAALAREGAAVLALRVVLVGRAPALDAFRTDRQRWLNETRSAVNGIGMGSIWLESLQLPPLGVVRTVTEAAAAEMPGDPLAEIEGVLRSLSGDPEQLVGLARQFDALFRKLPGEWKAGRRQHGPEDPEWLADRLLEAGLILADRLRQAGGGR